jgi:hypothetical protein
VIDALTGKMQRAGCGMAGEDRRGGAIGKSPARKPRTAVRHLSLGSGLQHADEKRITDW